MSVSFVGKVGEKLDAVAGSTSVVTTSSAVKVGDFLVLAARSGQGLNISSISDSSGNTWLKLNNSAAVQSTASVWYCPITTALASASTITVTFNGSTSGNRNVGVWAFNGVSRPITTNVTAQVGAVGTTISTANITPRQYNSLMFAAVGANLNTTFLVSSGWTSLPVSTSSVFLGAAYAIQNSMSDLATTWTVGTTAALGAVSASLTPDGGDMLAMF